MTTLEVLTEELRIAQSRLDDATDAHQRLQKLIKIAWDDYQKLWDARNTAQSKLLDFATGKLNEVKPL